MSVPDPATTPPASKARKVEFWLAAAVFAVPLWYLTTELTPDPFVFGWSKPWCALIVTYAVFYALLLLSYRWGLPRWLANLRSLGFATVLSLLVATVGVESALVLTDDPPFEPLDNSGRHIPDPDVGHVYKPNHRQRLQSREFSALWESNAQAVRAQRDFGPKPAGVTRVLCVGDSFTACDQVDYPQSWPGVLEQCLQAAGGAQAIEVVNAGHPGFGTVNSARWIKKFGGAFEPDVVLLAMTPNDLLENQYPLQYSARDGALVSGKSTDADRDRYLKRKAWWRLAAALERSHLAGRLRRSPNWRRLIGRRPYNHVEAYQIERSDKARYLYELAEGYVLEAKAHANELGATFAVLVIPYNHQLQPLGPGLDAARYGDHWRSFGAQHDFPVSDALPAFLAHPEPGSLHGKEDAHCTAAGYALVGQTACQLLREHQAQLGLTNLGN